MKAKRFTPVYRLLCLFMCTLFGVQNASAQEAYAYLADNDPTTFHFYNDNKRSERRNTGTTFDIDWGDIQPSWVQSSNNPDNITKVYFHDEIKPTSTHMWFAFWSHLTTIVNFHLLNTSQVTNMSMMFYECSSLTRLNFASSNPQNENNATNTNYFNTSNVVNMNSMFRGCTGLSSLYLSGWNTNKVVNMSYMFWGCSNLQSLNLCSEDIKGFANGWGTSSVTNMAQMFTSCSNLKTITVGANWTTAAVTNSTNMFAGCSSIKGKAGTTYNSSKVNKEYAHIDGGTSDPGYFCEETTPSYAVLSPDGTKLTFYQDWFKLMKEGTVYHINNGNANPDWYPAHATITQVEFDVSFAKARPTSTFGWFRDMTNLTESNIIGLENLNTSNTWYMNYMFGGCTNLHYLYLNSFDTKQVQDFEGMFSGCSNLEFVDVCSFNTANANSLSGMFQACPKLTVLDLSSFNPSNARLLSYMFSGCTNLKTIHVGSDWSIKSTAIGASMFYNCTSLVGGNGTTYSYSNSDKTYACIDASGTPGYLTKAAPYAVYNNGTLAFYYDGKINEKAGRKYTVYHNPYMYEAVKKTGVRYDGNYLKVTKVRFDMSFASARPTQFRWFDGMKNLESITLLRYLDTSSMTEMTNMFKECEKLTALDLSFFNTQNVKSFNYMFQGCSALTMLDLGSFNTAAVQQTVYMFYGCTNLNTIYVSDSWDINTLTHSNSTGMFSNCTSLVGGAGTTYSSSNTDRFYAIIDGGTSNPGYLTAATYVILNNGTLTFYADGKPGEKTGTKYSLNNNSNTPDWISKNTITSVVFDASFANCHPKTTAYWFYKLENLTSITGIENLNTSEVTSMRYMFYNCLKLTSLDLSGFNVSKVTDMLYMFANSSQLKTIYISPDWQPTNVTTANSSNMFYGCTSLVGGGGTKYDSGNVNKTYARRDLGIATPGYLSYVPYAVYTDNNLTLTFYCDGKPGEKTGSVFFANANGSYKRWDTTDNTVDLSVINTNTVVFDVSYKFTRATSTQGLFHGIDPATINNIKYLITDEVTDMRQMFWGCKKLVTLNLMTFNTKKVVKYDYMFYNCANLTTIYASNWDTQAEGVTSSYMFSSCPKLVGGAGTTYSVTNGSYAHIDGGTDNPGYFTSLAYVCFDNSTHTITFYDDGLSDEKNGVIFSLNVGTEMPGWVQGNDPRTTTTKAIFDPSFANAFPTTTYEWFDNMLNLESIEGWEYLNTSEVTNMGSMFWNCRKLTSIDLSHFNTSKVETMSNMFGHCYSLQSLDLSSFDTRNVTAMNSMFATSVDGGSLLTELDLSSFNTQNLTSMKYMFSYCSNLKTILVDGNTWSTANVTSSNSTDMFRSCTSLVGGAGTQWNESNPTNKTYAHIDGGTSNPGYLTNGTKEEYGVWNSTTKTLTHYFDHKKSQRASEGTVLDGQGYETLDEQDFPMSFDEIVKVVYDHSVAHFSSKGYLCGAWYCTGMTNLTTIEGLEYLDTSNESYFSYMFSNCNSLTTLDLSTFDTRNAKNMDNMFKGCTNLRTLTLGENFSTANVTNMSYMFANGCAPAVIDAVTNHEGFSTENVTNLSYMFQNNTVISGVDLHMFNTAKVANMNSMFEGCSSLTTILVDTGWSTESVTSSLKMFTGCTNLIGGDGTVFNSSYVDASYAHIDGGTSNPGYLTGVVYTPYVIYDETTTTLTFYADGKQNDKIGNKYSLPGAESTPAWIFDNDNNLNEFVASVTKVVFDPSFVTARPICTMQWFDSMTNLTEIVGVENLNTSAVTNMVGMFGSCYGLKTLDLSSFNTQNVTTMHGMFWGCKMLETIYVGRGWTTEQVEDGGNMFIGCYNLEGSAGTHWEENIHGVIDTDVISYAHVDGGEDNPGLLSGKTEAYVLKSGNTITFYYDAMRLLREGTTYDLNQGTNQPSWAGYTSIFTAIFDSSFAEARPTTTYRWFYSLISLADIQGIEYLNTSEVTTMNSMFYNCRSLTALDLSLFDTQKVTDMGSMFRGCTALKDVNLSSFDTSRRMSFNHMFNSCSSLEVLDLSSFNTAAVYNMTYMFYGSSALKTIYVSEGWDASNVVDQAIFTGCSSLVGGAGTACDGENNLGKAYARIDGGPSSSTPGYLTLKLDAYAVFTSGNTTLTFYYDGRKATCEGTVYELNTGSDNPLWYDDGTYVLVTNVVFDESFADARPTSTRLWFAKMEDLSDIEGIENLNTSDVQSMRSMFYGCSNLTNLDVSGFNTQNATDMRLMFYNCSKLTSLDVSDFDTQNVTDMAGMFSGCKRLPSIDVSNFNTQNVIDMTWMFQNCYSLTSLDVSGFITENVTNMAFMFDGCISLESLDVSGFNTQNVTGMNYMFHQCYALTSLDVSHFRTDNVTSMISMFAGCMELTSLDVSGFNTENVFYAGFAYMFSNCEKLTTLDVSNFSTGRVVYFDEMFYECKALKTLDLTNFDTSNAVSLYDMFGGCAALTTLDLSNFDTSNVDDMRMMFNGCTALTTIYVANNWNTETAAIETDNSGSSDMFNNCTSLVGGAGTSWNAANPTDRTYARIDGGSDNPGYFTEKAKLLGDVNNDGQVNVADVTALVNMLNTGNVNYNKVADVDGNGLVNNNDVKALVNFILGNAPTPIVLNYQVKAKPKNNYDPIMIDVDQRICDAFGLTVDQISDKIQCEFSSVVEDGCIMIYNYNDDGTFCSDDYNVGYYTPGYWLNIVGDIRNWANDDVVGAFCFSKDNKTFLIYQYPNRINSGDTMKFIFALRYNNGGEMITVGLTFNLTFSNEIDEDVVTLH